MVNITYKKVKYTFPTAYEELTLRQFFALRDNSKNVFKMLEILSGVPEKTWKHKIDIDLFDVIEEQIAFVRTDPPPFDSYLMPDTIEIAEKRYHVPAGIGMKTLAQKIAFEDAIRSGKTDVDLIPTALAIYFHPDIDDMDFDEDRLAACIELVLDCKVNEAFPIAGFFFARYIQYLKEKDESLLTNQAQKKSMPELTVSKSSASMARFGILRRLSILALRKWSEWITIPVLLSCSIKKKKPTINEHTTKP